MKSNNKDDNITSSWETICRGELKNVGSKLAYVPRSRSVASTACFGKVTLLFSKKYQIPRNSAVSDLNHIEIHSHSTLLEKATVAWARLTWCVILHITFCQLHLWEVIFMQMLVHGLISLACFAQFWLDIWIFLMIIQPWLQFCKLYWQRQDLVSNVAADCKHNCSY